MVFPNANVIVLLEKQKLYLGKQLILPKFQNKVLELISLFLLIQYKYD